MVQTYAYALAVNGQLKDHLLPKYMDLYIQTKDENWFLRMCHYVVIGIKKNPLAEHEKKTCILPIKCICVFHIILKIYRKYYSKRSSHASVYHDKLFVFLRSRI
jgi:hypothetical protein